MGTSLVRETAHEPEGRHDDARRAAECTPEFGIAANPTTIGALLRDADSGTRQRLALTLQRQHGNGAVRHLLAADSGQVVQRWAVTLSPATKDCSVILNYLNANSPHRASSGWAKTNASFNWGGDPVHSDSKGVITATVTNPTVTKNVSVDMPEWAPSHPGIAAAWQSMYGTLRAHETRHEEIADEWESTLTSRLSSLSVRVADRSLASFNAAVQAKWNSWLKEHQKAQKAIDPFSAVLDCSNVEPEGEAAEPGAEGEIAAGSEE
jgi:predicted secreted Zn-dependent protease